MHQAGKKCRHASSGLAAMESSFRNFVVFHISFSNESRYLHISNALGEIRSREIDGAWQRCAQGWQ
jgi:hypothetical protein